MVIDFAQAARRVRPSAAPSEHAPTASTHLADLIEPYRRYMVGESRRAEGIARYLWGYRRFLAWIGEGATVADITPATVQAYKEYLANERAAAPATIINALANLRDFARFCIGRGERTDDPTVGIARPKKQRPKPKPLYPHEIEALMDAIRMPPWLRERRRWHWRRNQRLVYLLLYSGLRLSEAAGLCWSDLKLPADLICVPATIAKNGKERTVKLHARLKTIL